MKEIKKNNLSPGDRVLFRMSHWSPVNLHFVEILFVGKEHVLMHNIDRDSEYCVKYDLDREVVFKQRPEFYVSEELK